MKGKNATLSLARAAVFVVFVLGLLGCTTPVPGEVEVTRVVEVERTVVETRVIEVEGESQIVEVTRVVTVEAEAPETAPEAVKTLSIGMSAEPNGWGVMVSQIARLQVEQSMNAEFVFRDGDLNIQPWLMEKIPSLDDGDLVVNDDGTVEVTWTLREDITWHDGAPVTVEDVIFGWEMLVDPDIPAFGKATAQKIDRIEKVDDRTFVIYWNEPDGFASQGWAQASRPIPTHILRDVYESDKEQFRNHPYWSTEFVGNGAYRMVEWVPGSHIVLEAYDDYFLGRPKIDRVVWRFLSDSNTLMANIITGDVEVTVIPSISIDQGLTVKAAWDVTGVGTVEFIPGFGWDWIVFNQQEDPKFSDVRVRKALMYAMDRQTLVDVLYSGFNPVAHGPIAPRHPMYTDDVEASMVKYEYNPELALELFAEAGWTPGPGGILTNAAGEPFTVSIRTVTGQKDKENAQAIIADYWREIGVDVELDNLPTSQIYDSMHLFRFGWPSAFLFNFGGNPNSIPNVYTCDQIPSEANSWSTANLGQFCNEEWDRVYNENPIDQVLDLEERARIAAQLMPIWTDNVAFMPLYYKSEVVTVRQGVTGVWATGTNEGWVYNIHEWDIEE